MIDRRGMLAGLGAACAAAGHALARPAAVSPFVSPSGLDGTWTNAWYTKLQRPRAFKTLVATATEANAYEAPRRAGHGELSDPVHDEVGQNESEFPDNGPGLARIHGEPRTSWIVDPPDGRIPWTPEGRKRMELDKGPDARSTAVNLDNYEARDTDERCLTTNSAGAPLINSHDANLMQIVVTRGHVTLVTEKNAEVRIIRLAGAGRGAAMPDPGPGLGARYGVSVGRWEGRTLVVETAGLRPGLNKIADDLSLSEHARVTERFTRTGPAEITYLFEVSDPTLFTQVWRGEEVFRPAEGRLFEYACHEGNYGLPNILAGARRLEGKTIDGVAKGR
jgi:hypothetical protein